MEGVGDGGGGVGGILLSPRFFYTSHCNKNDFDFDVLSVMGQFSLRAVVFWHRRKSTDF